MISRPQFIAIIISAAITLTLFIVFSSSYDQLQQGAITPELVAGTNSDGTPILLSAEEVAKHNTAADCWMTIDNKVYALETYIKSHPGGASRITMNCGKDGTYDYHNREGVGKDHSSNAKNLLTNYYIGDIGSTVTPVPTNNGAAANTVLQGSVIESIEKEYPGAEIIELNEEDDGSAEVKFFFEGRKYEAKLDGERNLVEIERD